MPAVGTCHPEVLQQQPRVLPPSPCSTWQKSIHVASIQWRLWQDGVLAGCWRKILQRTTPRVVDWASNVVLAICWYTPLLLCEAVTRYIFPLTSCAITVTLSTCQFCPLGWNISLDIWLRLQLAVLEGDFQITQEGNYMFSSVLNRMSTKYQLSLWFAKFLLAAQGMVGYALGRVIW